jgi:hypothetical protein
VLEGSDVYLRDVVAWSARRSATGRPRRRSAPGSLGVLGAVSSFGHAWRNGQIDLDADELAEFVGDWVARGLGVTAPVG